MDITEIKDELAIERLTLHLLQEAYLDLASALREARPEAASAILSMAEQRAVDVLSRISRERSEGEASAAITEAVGERLCHIMDQAHGAT